jgi:hypothetical protein
MPAPTNSKLPTPVSVTQGTVTVVSGASEPAKEQEIYNLSYFLAAMQTALAGSSTLAAFQAAMAALPQTP